MKKGTCKHFTGTVNATCAVGVNYQKHVGGPKFGWGCRMPCIIKYKAVDTVPCEKYEEPSAEEIAKTEAAFERYMDRMRKVMPVIGQIKKDHKGKTWQGIVACPACGGKLHLSHAGYNGHVWGKCETKDCVVWME